MKKLISAAALAMSALCCNAELPTTGPNSTWNMSVIGGYVGHSDPIHYGAVGMSLTIKGFYFDVMGFPAIHEKDVRVDKWDDKRSFLCHVGYQIPIAQAFRIIPVVGYANISSGVTDGWDWSAGSDGIYNKYHADKSISRFDFGGIAVFMHRNLVLSLAATRSAIYGGIGFEF